MKLTKKILAQCHIFNAYDIAKFQDEPKVFITYSPSTTGLGAQYAHWTIARIGFKTDLDGQWPNYNKEFAVTCRENKEPMRLEALEWSSERYNIDEWERSPFNSYHPKGTMDKVVENIK